MISLECYLVSIKPSNEFGVADEEVRRLIPIISVEDVYLKEFYEASMQGFKPSLALKISSLEYKGEEELIYMGIRYSVIRTKTPDLDELILICERKIANVE